VGFSTTLKVNSGSEESDVVNPPSHPEPFDNAQDRRRADCKEARSRRMPTYVSGEFPPFDCTRRFGASLRSGRLKNARTLDSEEECIVEKEIPLLAVPQYYKTAEVRSVVNHRAQGRNALMHPPKKSAGS
jgi:hypothetical protein